MGILGCSAAFVNLKSESYPEAKDFVAIPFFAIIFPVVRLFLDRYVFENLARRLVFGEGRTALDLGTQQIKRKNLNKFKDLKLKGLYMYVAGFYSYSIFALLFWETRHSDFKVSMAHHMASVALLALSYIFRFTRVGSVVLVLHDATDVFLEVAKMSRYSGYEQIAGLFFILFVFFWTILRIIYFPFRVLWSTSYEVLLALDMEKHMVDGSIYYYLFNTLLFCLLFYHIYWWKLMVGMVVEQIKARGQLGDDVRSDSEGEDEHDD